MAALLTLVLLVLFVYAGVFAIRSRKRGLKLPPPKLSQEPIAVKELSQLDLARLARDAREQKKIAEGKRAYIPKPGAVWNPMRDYPRNARCTCGSGKKFKACCSSKLPETIPFERAANLRQLVKMAKEGKDVPAMIAQARAKASERPGSREVALTDQGGVSGQNSPGLELKDVKHLEHPFTQQELEKSIDDLAHPAVDAPA